MDDGHATARGFVPLGFGLTLLGFEDGVQGECVNGDEENGAP
jgi:hypothetical protein